MALPYGSAALLIFALSTLYFFCQVVYNLFFHPLRRYPGPLLWRASSLPKNFFVLMGTYPTKCVEFHIKYPGTIRVAPNELCFIEAQAWKDIFGRPLRSELSKDYRFFGGDLVGPTSLITATPEVHGRMRRLFSHAFTNTALKAQEPLLIKYADQMVEKMGEMNAKNGSINMVDLFNFCTFDIMADLAFGEPLFLLKHGDYIPSVHAIFAGLKFIVFRSVLLQIPILGPLLNALTAGPLKKKADETLKFTADLVDRRLSWTDHKKPDIWNFVLQHTDDGKGLSRAEMHSNSAMFMVAGTETTATTLSGVLYYLMNNPRVYSILVREIRSTFAESNEIALASLSQMEYLNAVVNEGLRIYIPGGSGMARIVPPGGVEICREFVPAGTLVSMNHYVSYRHPDNWYRPLEFIPERWIHTDDPRFVGDNREVHEPFSYGPRNCLGKNLAWFELRLLLAKTLWHYDLEACPESKDWIIQRSYLTWEKGPLMARLTTAH